ncbi:hypothetical protein Sjap_017807 [Stephania japonica]|uniref:Uncharacterized protein n=1 Tax=Stephania japonica TaxID=461633 RepID=A0AAP0NIP4_9MAGN
MDEIKRSKVNQESPIRVIKVGGVDCEVTKKGIKPVKSLVKGEGYFCHLTKIPKIKPHHCHHALSSIKKKNLGEEEESVEKEKSRRGRWRFARGRGRDVKARFRIIVHTGTIRGVSESVLARISLDRDPQSSKGKAVQLGDIL